MHLQSRAPGPAARLGGAGVDHQPLLIGRVHLLQLDQERAAPSLNGAWLEPHGIAQVGAGGVLALLIGEGALQHQDFLASAMAMALEATAGA